MREFKEGDKVKVISNNCPSSYECNPCKYIGKIGIIKNPKYTENRIWVTPFEGIRKPNGCSGFTAKDLVLVKLGGDEVIYA